MKIVLLGPVDAGKTTFFKKYFSHEILEYGNRTEEIRVLKLPFNNQMYLLDNPGHTMLSKFRELSLAMADLVLYFMDATATSRSFDFLDCLDGKPCIVLFNKIDLRPEFQEFKGSSLKQVLQDEKKKYLLHKLLSTLGQDWRVAPFLDNDSTKAIGFPLSIKSSFGMSQLESFITQYYVKKKQLDRSFLYLAQSTLKKKVYYLVGPFNKDLQIVIQGRSFLWSQFFTFKKSKGCYEIKQQGQKILGEPELVQLFDPFRLGTDSLIKKPSLAVEQIDLQEVKQLIKEPQKFQFFLRSDDPRKVQTIENIFFSLGVPLKEVNYSPKKFLQIRSPNQYFLQWGGEQVVDPTIFHSQSIYGLLDQLKQFFSQLKREETEQVDRTVKSYFVGELLDRVFKLEKKELVVGLKPLYGTLKVGPIELFSQSKTYTGQVLSIKSQNSSFTKWDKPDPCAVKISCNNCFQLVKQTFYVRSEGLEEFLNQDLINKEFLKLRDVYLKCKQ